MVSADVADDESTTGDRAREPDGGTGSTGVRGWLRVAEPRSSSRFLAVASVVPGLIVGSWVVVAFPLTALGLFRPAIVVPLVVAVAAVVLPLGLRLTRGVGGPGPRWPAMATAAVAIGFTVFAALTHSAHVVPRRDAGSYAQIGYWLAHHPSPFYRVPLAAFGTSPGQLGFASPAFYQHGATVVPQFMTGWPTMLAGAYWAGGWTGLLVLPAIMGGCAVLAAGGLAGRLMGARWAPLAAALTAAAWPVLRSAQETLSEPAALVVLAAGLCLLVDVVTAPRGTPGVGRVAFVAGLVLSAGELIRVDFGVDYAFVLPVIGWLWLTRRPGWWQFLAGSVIGGGLGMLDGAFVTRTYIHVNWSSVKLMLLLLAVMSVAVVAGAVLLRRYGTAWWRRVAPVAAAVVVLVEIGLFVRPYVSTDHSNADPGVRKFVANAQRALGLPVDGTRGYAENSLRWVAWYLGWVTLVAAGIGAVYLTWRVLRGQDRRWLPVLLPLLCTAVLTLVRPGITPDHPWADRRLVVEVLPCVALLATWTTAAVAARVRSRGWRVGAVTVLVAAFVVPMAVALTPVSVERTEQGELAATGQVCGTLGANDTVLLVDQQWMPIVRAQCGLPVAQLLHPSPATVARAAASVRAAGRTPVIAGSQTDSPTPLGLTAYARITLDTREDARELLRRPDSTLPLRLVFWAARPS
ncbi:MAG TPA: hypothetical protein VFW65_40195 [Pseudonocardiaceae bacterium]|nr:hypothetical protein [Pseudonocardiaceae bacterium]